MLVGLVRLVCEGGGKKINRQTNKQTNEQLNKWSNNKEENYSKRSNQGMGVVLFIREKYSLSVMMRVKWIEVT